ncbi:MAG: helix-turn-helix transcriptional regulator [Pseudomonadota bacterium]
MLLHQQLKQRRKALGLQQSDLLLRIGMNQQQYQRIEADGNPRLETLALIAQGLEAEVVLVPKARLDEVLALLAQTPGTEARDNYAVAEPTPSSPPAVDVDPWAGMFDHADR